MKTRITLCLFVLLVAACGAQINDPVAPSVSGVKGQTILGPMCPVVRVGQDCPDQAYPASLTVRTPEGQEVTRLQSDAAGKFQINLPPGDYILHPENLNGSRMPTAADVPFTVLPDQFTNVIVTFDSGIR